MMGCRNLPYIQARITELPFNVRSDPLEESFLAAVGVENTVAFEPFHKCC
jgi:hypothetical protein